MSETKTKNKTKLLIPVIAVAVVAVVVVVVLIAGKNGKSTSGQITTVISKLEKIMEINDLETAEISYNAVATKTDEAGEKVQYYAAYEGKIKAGISFKDVIFVPDEETKTITAALPAARVLETTVNPGTIEYIFINKKAETETVAQEAYRLCVADLEKRSAEDTDRLLETAYDNARNAIEGLLRPWMEQMDGEYKLEIR